jgi:hypothetical protein
VCVSVCTCAYSILYTLSPHAHTQVVFKLTTAQDALDIFVLFLNASDAAKARQKLDQRYVCVRESVCVLVCVCVCMCVGVCLFMRVCVCVHIYAQVLRRPPGVRLLRGRVRDALGCALGRYKVIGQCALRPIGVHASLLVGGGYKREHTHTHTHT